MLIGGIAQLESPAHECIIPIRVVADQRCGDLVSPAKQGPRHQPVGRHGEGHAMQEALRALIERVDSEEQQELVELAALKDQLARLIAGLQAPSVPVTA
jgi:hypothetical protein